MKYVQNYDDKSMIVLHEKVLIQKTKKNIYRGKRQNCIYPTLVQNKMKHFILYKNHFTIKKKEFVFQLKTFLLIL